MRYSFWCRTADVRTEHPEEPEVGAAGVVLSVASGILMFTGAMNLGALRFHRWADRARSARSWTNRTCKVRTTLLAGRYEPITVPAGALSRRRIGAPDGSVSG